MKKIFSILFILFFSFFVFSMENIPEQITIAFEDADNYPWQFPDKTGLNFEMLKIVEKNLGIKFVYQPLPWKRCLEIIKENKVDAVLNASFKKDRLEIAVYPTKSNGEIDPSKQLHTEGYALYILKDSKIGWDGEKFINVEGK